MKFKHSLSVRPHVSKDGSRSNLFLRLTVCGQRKELPTGITLPSAAYLSEPQPMIVSVPDYPDAAMDNLHLQQQISTLNSVMMQMELTSAKVPSLNDVIASFNAAYHGSPNILCNAPLAASTKVVDAFQKFYDSEIVNQAWTEGTAKHKRTIRQHLSAFRPSAVMADIDDDWLIDFMRYVSETLAASTLEKLLINIRGFLRWCNKKGLYEGTSHETFKPAIKGADYHKEVLYLTTEELNLLETHKWEPHQQHLERVVDAFLFACFTGMRHSDVYNLRRSSIYGDTVHYTAIKTTTKSITVPLNSHSRRILDKYHDYKDRFNHPFPICTDQRCNEYIKDACKLCGIDTPTTETKYKNNKRTDTTRPKYELITFHCARRTFITQALALGIPSDVIMQFSGHSDHRMLRPYLAVTDKVKQENMRLFDTLNSTSVPQKLPENTQ